MTMTVANTILAQLGGNRFLAMTGARNLLGDKDHLRFNIPRGMAKNKATVCRVRLDPSDTYTVSFFQWNARKLEMKPLGEVAGVYVDQLRDIFTAETGLLCTL